jgi:hypothetical protein
MSIRVVAAVWGCTVGSLVVDQKIVTGPAAKAVLLALADHANDYGDGCYASLTLLQLKTEYTRPSVILALKALEAQGFIAYKGVSRLGTSDYSINLDKLAECAYKRPTKRGSKVKAEPSKPALPQPSKVALPEPSIKPSSVKPLTTAQGWIKILSEMTGMDYEIKSNAGQMARTARELGDAGYTPAHLAAFNKLWASDWRGRKGQKPTLKQITEKIGEAKPKPEDKELDPDTQADLALVRMSPASPLAFAARKRLEEKGVQV